MNNEEKILQILTAMQADISGLKEGQDSLKTDISGLKEGQAKLEETQTHLSDDLAAVKGELYLLKDDMRYMSLKTDTLKDDVTRVRQSVAVIEVEHGNKLGALLDGNKSHQEQLVALTEHVTRLGQVQEIHDVKLTKIK